MTSLQPLKPDRAAGLLRQTIRIEGTLPESALAELLVALAMHRPLLLVQDMSIRPMISFASLTRTAPDIGPQLTVRVDVTGYGGLAKRRGRSSGP